jgi:hypothetical protein
LATSSKALTGKAVDAAGYQAACAGMAERLPRGDPKLSHHESNTAARATVPKPGAAWERAEVELLATELDAALPPAGK